MIQASKRDLNLPQTGSSSSQIHHQTIYPLVSGANNRSTKLYINQQDGGLKCQEPGHHINCELDYFITSIFWKANGKWRLGDFLGKQVLLVQKENDWSIGKPLIVTYRIEQFHAFSHSILRKHQHTAYHKTLAKLLLQKIIKLNTSNKKKTVITCAFNVNVIIRKKLNI